MAEGFDVATEAKEEKVFTVAGLPFPTSPLITPQSTRKALTLRLQPTDVILSSYPKCDSKIIDSIVWKLLYNDLKHPPVNSLTNRFLPCIEMENIDELATAYEHILRQKLPRLYKTYLPYKLIPFYKRAKYIYVIRTPWEVCASFYKFLVMQDSVTDSFDAFFNDFLNGKVAYGSFFKHIMPWNKRINDSNVLILCHEHVEHNPRSAMFSIAAFLGDSYLSQLMDNVEVEKHILSSTNYEEDKSKKRFLPKCRSAKSGTSSNDFSEFRYCSEVYKVNSFKPTCTVTQLKEITDKVSEWFKDSSIEFLWLNLLKRHSPVLFT